MSIYKWNNRVLKLLTYLLRAQFTANCFHYEVFYIQTNISKLKHTEHVPAYKNLEHSVLHYDCTFLANGLPVIAICNDNPFEFGLFARHAARRKAVETQIENFVSNIEQCLRKVGYPIFEARPCYNCANIFIKKGDVVQTVAQNKCELKLSKLTVTIGTFHHKLSWRGTFEHFEHSARAVQKGTEREWKPTSKKK